jgi:hypothetical protein
VAEFLGFKNLLSGKLSLSGEVETTLGVFYPPVVRGEPGANVTLVLRPEGARLAKGDADTDRNPVIRGKVASRLFNGQNYRVGVSAHEGRLLYFDLPNEEPPPLTGEPIHLRLLPSHLFVIDHQKSAKSV